MAEWFQSYASAEAQDLPNGGQKIEPKAPDWNDPVERTQFPKRDRTSRPLNDVAGDAHNVSYIDPAFDAKLAQCKNQTLRLTELPTNVGVAFWKNDKGYFFYFQNGQDNKKPHYLPVGVTKIETMRDGKIFSQDMANVKATVDQAIAKEIAAKKAEPPKPPALIPTPPNVLQPPRPDAGKQEYGKPGEYKDGKPWTQTTPKVGLANMVTPSVNLYAQRATSLGAEYYFGKMAYNAALTPAATDAAAMNAMKNKAFNQTVGALAAGEMAKYVIDRNFFPNADPSVRTYIIDGLAPAVVLTKLPWYAKAAVIVGAHTGARIMDVREK